MTDTPTPTPPPKQPAEPTPVQPLGERLSALLKAHNATLVVRVMTPRGETISVDNFLPAGWSAVIQIAETNGQNRTG